MEVQVELTVMERLTLLNVLPEKGSLATLRLVRELRESLGFTEQEIKDYRMVIEEGQVTWKLDKAKVKAFTFGATVTSLIVTTLENLDKQENVEMQHLSLMEKFQIGG